jgi:hypothetical protein
MSVSIVLYSNVFDTSVDAQIALVREQQLLVDKEVLLEEKRQATLKEEKELALIKGTSGILNVFDLLFD